MFITGLCPSAMLLLAWRLLSGQFDVSSLDSLMSRHWTVWCVLSGQFDVFLPESLNLLIGHFSPLCFLGRWRLCHQRWVFSGLWACSICWSCGRSQALRRWPWTHASSVRCQDEEHQEVSTPTRGAGGAGCGTSSLSWRSSKETSHCMSGRYQTFKINKWSIMVTF